MKVVIAVSVLATLVLAEPPISNSYLPPPANGFPSSGPQVVAARNLNSPPGFPGRSNGLASARGFHGNQAGLGLHGNQAGHGLHGNQAAHGLNGNQFGRSAFPGQQGKFSGQAGYDQSAGAFGRNGLEELSGEPAMYNFGYAVNDSYEGTEFGHQEHRKNDKAEGEYHVVLPDGRKQTVNYEADERGFKPRISYEDSDVLNGYSDNSPQNSGFANARARGY